MDEEGLACYMNIDTIIRVRHDKVSIEVCLNIRACLNGGKLAFTGSH